MKYTHVVYRCICMRKHSIRCCEVELCQQDKDLWRYIRMYLMGEKKGSGGGTVEFGRGPYHDLTSSHTIGPFSCCVFQRTY